MTFIPPGWTEQMVRTFHEAILRPPLPIGPQPYTYERVPRDPAWLEARAEFAKRWEAIRAEGFENGWLEHDHCYECEGATELTTDTTTTVRHPNPDYVPQEFDSRTLRIPRAEP